VCRRVSEADRVGFLAGRGSDCVTGQTLMIDGGCSLVECRGLVMYIHSETIIVITLSDRLSLTNAIQQYLCFPAHVPTHHPTSHAQTATRPSPRPAPKYTYPPARSPPHPPHPQSRS